MWIFGWQSDGMDTKIGAIITWKAKLLRRGGKGLKKAHTRHQMRLP
jgi:hypothetical protein